jgi:hypothetical protein
MNKNNELRRAFFQGSFRPGLEPLFAETGSFAFKATPESPEFNHGVKRISCPANHGLGVSMALKIAMVGGWKIKANLI